MHTNESTEARNRRNTYTHYALNIHMQGVKEKKTTPTTDRKRNQNNAETASTFLFMFSSVLLRSASSTLIFVCCRCSLNGTDRFPLLYWWTDVFRTNTNKAMIFCGDVENVHWWKRACIFYQPSRDDTYRDRDIFFHHQTMLQVLTDIYFEHISKRKVNFTHNLEEYGVRKKRALNVCA